MPAPAASGWSGRRAGLTPAGKEPPCHGARGFRTFAGTRSGDKVAPIPAIPETAGIGVSFPGADFRDPPMAAFLHLTLTKSRLQAG